MPKVVVPFHPHFGSPFHWTYNASSGAKEAWHLAYEHSLIAAVPKAELINDWFTQMKTNLQTKYSEVIKKFEACKINDHKWIN
uniref:Predicted protein n=1 Tax=Hordeum vulgare subsp. vulgare TaxID=112509 RepID=F2E7V7_HORVV|nr:predicted protein [Hordeum vulgare subsp. vulgare]